MELRAELRTALLIGSSIAATPTSPSIMTRLTSKALDDWAYRRSVKLDFTVPEPENERLRDGCLNVESAHVD
jgi:hypothetical protein